MLKLLGNNFILAGVVALILVIIVFVERRSSDKKNNTKSIKDGCSGVNFLSLDTFLFC